MQGKEENLSVQDYENKINEQMAETFELITNLKICFYIHLKYHSLGHLTNEKLS